jgi:RNA polymerase sigma-70 factor (ECF subfamily)
MGSNGRSFMSIPWEEFVVTNVRVVLDAAQRVLANTADAEDVAQEVFLEIHRTNRLAEFASAPGLLRTMATRRALDRLRRRRATTGLQQLDLPSREPDPSDQAVAMELDRQLREALAELPPREAEVFCLCVFEGLEGRFGSARQRYGELTVYVPACTSICVRGARRGLDVKNVSAELTIVDEDSTDSDARGRFEVDGLQGDLVCRNFPLRTVANIACHVAIEATTEWGIGGTNYRHDQRQLYSGRPFVVNIRNVIGGVDLRYGRVDLNLDSIDGTINVENEYGNTTLVSEVPLLDGPHRIVSQTGRIDVTLNEAAWSSVPVVAVTYHGDVRTNVDRNLFDSFHLEGPDKLDQVRRTWQGFRAVGENEGPLAVFDLQGRFQSIIKNQERPTGLDILSRSGSITVLKSE